GVAYVAERDLFRVEDDLFAHVWPKAAGEALATPIPTITFDEAWARYGSDCPDLRFGLELAGPADGAWSGFAVPGGAAKLKEKELADLAKLAGDGRAGTVQLVGA